MLRRERASLVANTVLTPMIHHPRSLLTHFARRSLEVTFRRDPTNFRPRINKYGSQKDQEQKASGAYFFYDEDED